MGEDNDQFGIERDPVLGLEGLSKSASRNSGQPYGLSLIVFMFWTPGT